MAGTSKQIIGQKDDEDYISLLPDCLIHEIFSYLSTTDVVKTCVLSKRWQFVWTTVSDLRFVVYFFGSSFDERFVDRVLTRYGCGKVKKFHLLIESRLCYHSKIDTWVRFAIDHQVEELLLEFTWWADYTLSPLVYNCSSLTKLCLRRCGFSSNETIGWSSLKSLSMESMNVSDDVLRKILMGSRALEYLNLTYCSAVRAIHSTSLEELRIDDTVAGSPLHISTPRLLSLRARECPLYETIRIVEAPSLLEAELDFDSQTVSDFRLLKEMLCKLQNATRILFGSWWARVTWPQKVEDVQVSLPNCKSLTLHVPIPYVRFPAIANMLATTPNLEKLVLILKTCEPYSAEWDWELFNHDPEVILDKSYERIKKKVKRWARRVKNVEMSLRRSKYFP